MNSTFIPRGILKLYEMRIATNQFLMKRSIIKIIQMLYTPKTEKKWVFNFYFHREFHTYQNQVLKLVDIIRLYNLQHFCFGHNLFYSKFRVNLLFPIGIKIFNELVLLAVNVGFVPLHFCFFSTFPFFIYHMYLCTEQQNIGLTNIAKNEWYKSKNIGRKQQLGRI